MTPFHSGRNTLLLLLALGTMVGCQGLSSGTKATPPSSSTQPGQLTTSQGNISFGNVAIGRDQTQVLTLTNSGGSSLTVFQVTASGTGFTASGATFPLILTTGQSKALNVTFTPQSSGSTSGNLAIANNGSTPTVNVALSGAGMSVAPTPRGILTPKPANLNFGTVQREKSLTITEILTNTGNASLNVTQTMVTGTGFSISGINLPLMLAANQSTSFSVTFAPNSTGNSNGNVAITYSGSIPTLDITLTGTGTSPGINPQGTLTVNPTSLNFGSVQPGKKLTLSESLNNIGSATLTISHAPVTGSGFTITGLTLPLVLEPGQSFTFGVTFAPPAVGSDSGTISLISDASDPRLTVPLVGGAPNSQLSVVPTSMNLGSVIVGSQGQQTGTLSASGGSVTVFSVTMNDSEFTITGISFPVTIPAGQSVNFTVTFSPRATGQASGRAFFASDAFNSPTLQLLTGQGVSAHQYHVDLSWNASTSHVVGYQVYRGTEHGGPYPIRLGSLDPNTTYTDSSVAPGQTYYYVVTAVNAKHVESSYSNEVKVVIPSP